MRLKSILRWLAELNPWYWAIAVSVLVLIGRWPIFFADAYANGYDGYYYALQARAVMETGKVLNNDGSLIFYWLGGLAAITRDPVFAVKLSGVLSGLAAIPLFFLLHGLGCRKFLAAGLSLVFLFGYSLVYLSFETLKSGFSVSFLFGFIWSLWYIGQPNQAALWLKLALALLFLVLAALCHKATAALACLFVLVYGIVYYFSRNGTRPRPRRWIGYVVIAGLVGTVAIISRGSFGTLRWLDLQQFLTQISLDLGRFKVMARDISSPLVLAELLFWQVLPFILGVVYLFVKQRPVLVSSALIVSILITAPILTFAWDSIAYRLLLISGCFSLPVLAWLIARLLPGRALQLSLTSGLALLCIVSLPQLRQYLHQPIRYPDYQTLDRDLEPVAAALPPGAKLIAHQGLDTFVWYKTRHESGHFAPEHGPAGYWRIAYGLGPVHFLAYQSIGEAAAIRLNDTYTLVPETIWQRFWQVEGQRLAILRTWRNPYQKRPDFVYRPPGE